MSRTIAEYDDTRPLARKYLNARALDMARRFVEKARPADVLEMMGRLNVIPRPNDRGAVGVQVLVNTSLPGMPGYAGVLEPGDPGPSRPVDVSAGDASREQTEKSSG